MRVYPVVGVESVARSDTSRAIAPAKNFQDLLKQGINYVDSLQKRADGMMEAYASGKTQDIHEVMLAVTEANIALQLTVSIRNQALQSYQEIMRMQV